MSNKNIVIIVSSITPSFWLNVISRLIFLSPFISIICGFNGLFILMVTIILVIYLIWLRDYKQPKKIGEIVFYKEEMRFIGVSDLDIVRYEEIIDFKLIVREYEGDIYISPKSIFPKRGDNNYIIFSIKNNKYKFEILLKRQNENLVDKLKEIEQKIMVKK